MLNYLKEEANVTYTENGAITPRTTGSDNLDFFGNVGGMRHNNDAMIIKAFSKAFYEKREYAMKTLFYSRDVRGGLGERRIFRVCMTWLANECPDVVARNLENFQEYGRFDDMWCLLDTAVKNDVIKYVDKQLKADIENYKAKKPISLLAKWMPSSNTSSAQTRRYAKQLREGMKIDERSYRKTLACLRKYISIVEHNLSEKNYDLDYSKIPSGAMFKYRKAFLRNDEENYRAFFSKVEKGEEKLKTSSLTPYDIVEKCWGYWGETKPSDIKFLDITWNQLEDYTKGENALVMLDGSGSMWGTPINIGMSLAIYFAERNHGPFKNHFMTFSMHPQMVEIKGNDIYEKVQYCRQYNEVANTNLEAAFDLILNTAVKHHLSQDEMPKKLYIISDMQFDSCVKNSSLSNFEAAKKEFNEHGYELPQIVFWNVNCYEENVPVKMNERNVYLVSGSNPSVFAQVMQGDVNPMTYMLHVILSDRYKAVAF